MGDKIKFTDRTIKSYKVKDKRYKKIEPNGLALCIYPSGRKIFYYRYKFDGRYQEVTLGIYGVISLADAREKHQALWSMRQKGKNPKLYVDQNDEVKVVEDLADDYIERYAKPNKSSWEEDKRILDNDIVPALGRIQISEVRRKHIQKALNTIIDRGSRNQAWQTLKVVRKMFNWGIEQDAYGLEFNPCAQIKIETNPSTERNLSFDEIIEFWSVLDRCNMDIGLKNILRLILITGQRPGEISGIHSREIDGKWWTIPKERIKTRKKVNQDHRVYLSPLALRCLCEKGYDGYHFRSGRTGNAYNKSSLDHALARLFEENRKVRLDMPTFTPHDLRRTMATRCAEIGLDHFKVDRVQNHVIPGVGGRVYNKWAYDPQKREILVLWSRHLQKVVGPGWKGSLGLLQGKAGVSSTL